MLKNFIASATCSVVMIFLSALMFTSCERDFLPTSDPVEVVSSEQETPKTKALTDIGVGVYNIDPIYKSSYVHYKQGEVGCGPLNYILAMRAIIRGNNSSSNYASNIYDAWQDVITAGGTTAQTVSQLYDYWYENDRGWGVGAYMPQETYSHKTTSGREGITEAMIYQLADNRKPLLFLGAMKNRSNQWVGHYYIVWNITWRGSLSTSTIYVTDTTDSVKSSFDQQIKSYNLLTFLNNAEKNPQASNFRILCFYWFLTAILYK